MDGAWAALMHAWQQPLLTSAMSGVTFVLFAEIINSAIEALCDFVEERHNEKIKIIKDMAAAAIGIAILSWITVIEVEAGRYLSV